MIRIDYPWTPRVARYRSFRVFIDGKRAGSVKNGTSTDIPTTPGKHVLQVKMDWLKSPDVMVAVQPGGTVSLRATTATENARKAMVDMFLHPSRFIQLTTA
jgi:hypothetical protein